jgi:hypothetical protein
MKKETSLTHYCNLQYVYTYSAILTFVFLVWTIIETAVLLNNYFYTYEERNLVDPLLQSMYIHTYSAILTFVFLVWTIMETAVKGPKSDLCMYR